MTKNNEKINVLVVCRWPLGGIRTYLKYYFHYFPKSEFNITILAANTIETSYLIDDMEKESIEVVVSSGFRGKEFLSGDVLKLLLHRKFDLINSQGFTSAVQVAAVNKLVGKPHVLTMHGVIEKKYFEGKAANIKRFLFNYFISNVDVFLGVGEDITNHVKGLIPQKYVKHSEFVTIRNGIEPDRFFYDEPEAGKKLHQLLGISDDCFIFSYFGRFMLEKGFNYIIEAVEKLAKQGVNSSRFVVLAMGSGDYETAYKRKVNEYNLEKYFHFKPFTPDISSVIKGCDTVIMPSIWEAYPLLSSEVLVAGIPLIATTCHGLREATADTPAVRIPAGDSDALKDAMIKIMADKVISKTFRDYKQTAYDRFHIKKPVNELIQLYKRIAGA